MPKTSGSTGKDMPGEGEGEGEGDRVRVGVRIRVRIRVRVRFRVRVGVRVRVGLDGQGRAVEDLVLEEDHRVVVTDGRLVKGSKMVRW